MILSKKIQIENLNKALTNIVCFTGVSIDMLKSEKRGRKLSDIRKTFFKACDIKGYTSIISGSVLNRDHATFLHNVKSFNNLMNWNYEFKLNYNPLLKNILNILPPSNIEIREEIVFIYADDGPVFLESLNILVSNGYNVINTESVITAKGKLQGVLSSDAIYCPSGYDEDDFIIKAARYIGLIFIEKNTLKNA